MTLTSRQQAVLNIIVDDYIKSATPIASEVIARNHDLGVSPATVRNDVGHLEEEGYLTRPHTSAGSIPLDDGYRFYVESRVPDDVDDIVPAAKSSIRRQFNAVEHDVEEWTSVAATALTRLVGNMAIATFPRAKESQVKHLELVQLQDFLVMLIVVLEQARLRRQLIRLSSPADAAELETCANRVKKHIVGLTRREIESRTMELPPLGQKLVDAAVVILREEERAGYCEHYVDGLRNLLGQPEFAESEKARALVETVEDESLVQAVLEATPDGGVVRVIIGQENRGDMLWPLSVVICQYGIPDEAMGAVGVVGPTRMEYAKTIAGVRFMSSVMGDLVEGVSSG